MPLLSVLILFIPMSAYAESLTVTTNKDIYTNDEKAIIAGAIPADAPAGYAVLIKVTGPRGNVLSRIFCPQQTILLSQDQSGLTNAALVDSQCRLIILPKRRLLLLQFLAADM